MNKAISTPIVIIVLAVVIVVGGAVIWQYLGVSESEVVLGDENEIISEEENGKIEEIDISDWKTLSVEPFPGKKVQIKYPPDWDGSELSFSCEDVNAQILATISPSRTDLSGNENISVAYLIQYCVFDNVVIRYQGFIKSPLFHQPKEEDKILLHDEILKNTEEYKITEKIISTLKVID